MKIDFQTIIYLIITLVFVIVGSLGKKKKPVNQQMDENADPDAIAEMEQESQLFSENLGNILRDTGEKFEGIKEEGERIYQDSPFADYSEEPKSEFYEDNMGEKPQEATFDSPVSTLDTIYGSIDRVDEIEGVSMIDSSEGIHDVIKLTEMGSENEQASTSSPVEGLLRSFSGRAAIIYSEILNHKYF